MSPTPASSSPSPHAPRSDGHPRYTSLIFWPILFGVILIALIWKFWTWKAKLGTSTGPLSTPKPPTSDVIRMAHMRGAPLVGRPLAALRATVLNPPPPAYVHPPRYDNSSPPYDGGARPS